MRFAVLILFLAVATVLQHEATFVQSKTAQGPLMRWCYKGDKEKDKCLDMKVALEAAANAVNLTVTASCVNGSDAVGCLKLIKEKTADLVTLDGGDIMKGEADVVPIVSEQHADTGISYYAVAVVKTSNKGFNLKNLKGKKTCHTGARRSAGWTIPVGYMLSSGLMPAETCSPLKDFLAAADFFGKSCVPGIAKFNTSGKIPGNLCAICKKDCTSNDEYAGYTGAFKCMAEGAGDVAFVKHTIAGEVVGNGTLDDYKYLCKDGTRKAIGQHKECNLGTSPAHAVVARKGDPHTEHHYVLVLIELAKLYGVNQTDAARFQLFNSSKYGNGNLLFKDSAVGLKEIKTKTIEGYMGDYAKDYKALTSCDGTAEPTIVPGKASVTSMELFMFLSLLVAALMI